MHAALVEWRHWLEGAQHPMLIWTVLFSLLFNRFNFNLTYRPGSKNVRADALSRLFQSENAPQTILPPTWVVVVVTWGLESAVRAAQHKDPVIASSSPSPPVNLPVIPGFEDQPFHSAAFLVAHLRGRRPRVRGSL